MEELKTLKDLVIKGAEKYGMCEYCIQTAKQEAIKWLNDKETYENFDHTKNYWRFIFMNFFNITEEDLE